MVIVEYASPLVVSKPAGSTDDASGLSATGGGVCSLVSKTWSHATAHTRSAAIARLAVFDPPSSGCVRVVLCVCSVCAWMGGMLRMGLDPTERLTICMCVCVCVMRDA